MSDIKDGVNVKIKTVKIKDEPDEEKCSEGSLEDIVHEEEEFSRHSDEGISLKTEGLSFINATGNIFPSGTQMDEIQHLSCGVTCRGQLALEKHMLERHKSSQGNEGVAWGKQSGCGLPILSTIILPGPLWSGERRVTFHHCPECPQCFQCLKSQNCVLRGAENGEETPREVAETLYHCVKCGKLFRQKGALRGHHRTHAEAVAQACANQRKTLKLSTPPVHRIQSMKTLYHCDGSKETMGKLCAAKTDGNEHATKQSYHCEACGLDFSLHRSLCDHQRAHRDVVFDCTVCGKSFRHARNLERHQRVHMGETPYQCRDCDKTFSQVGSLRLHQRVHTGETPYRCTFCEKSFSQLENLKRHRRTHTGETPYPCNECGKSFSQLGNLKAHLRIHTGETPFSCSVCGKSFKNKGNLKAHCRIHTGETPFQCKDCGKSFGWLAALKTHQRTHTGEKPYHCERCGERFTYSYKLHTHGCHAS